MTKFLYIEDKTKFVSYIKKTYPIFKKYAAGDIIQAYSEYCSNYHAANWTSVNESEFIAWATNSPIERISKTTIDITRKALARIA